MTVYLVPGYPNDVYPNEILDLGKVNLNDLYSFYYSNITQLNNNSSNKMKFMMHKSRALAIALEDHLELPRIVDKNNWKILL